MINGLLTLEEHNEVMNTTPLRGKERCFICGSQIPRLAVGLCEKHRQMWREDVNNRFKFGNRCGEMLRLIKEGRQHEYQHGQLKMF